MKRTALIAIVAVLGGSSGWLGGEAAAQAGASSATSGVTSAATGDAIDRYMGEVMARMHVPGAAIAVVRGGKVEKLSTYGVANLEWQAPVTADTAFQIASTTKIFTGTLVMQLVAEGKLALEANVARYLPDAPAAWREVTIGHLVSHTSGIAHVFDPKLASVAEAYAVIREKPLDYAPGTKEAYVSGDFVVLSHVLQRITGLGFAELLRERLVKPLGLTCTTFEDAVGSGAVRTAKVVPRRASVYRWSGVEQTLQWFLYPAYTYSMGGAFSCVADLAKWAVAMDEGRLLSAAAERRAATAMKLRDGGVGRAGGFGVAFAVGAQRGLVRYGHSGGPALADVVRLPAQKLTVIALVNQHRLHPVLAGTIAGMVLAMATATSGGVSWAGKAKAATAIRDAHPAWSERLREVVAGLAAAPLDEQALAPPHREGLGKMLRDWGPVIAGMWPALERWALVEERAVKEASAKEGAKWARVYRAQHGAIAVRWKLTLDEAGRLVDLDASPD